MSGTGRPEPNQELERKKKHGASWRDGGCTGSCGPGLVTHASLRYQPVANYIMAEVDENRKKTREILRIVQREILSEF